MTNSHLFFLSKFDIKIIILYNKEVEVTYSFYRKEKNMELDYIEITKDNIDFATKIQEEIFPGESAYEHYLYTINKNEEYEKYYLVYDKEKIVGITGTYSNEPLEETNSLWLGWYGVLPTERNKGYGTKILKDTIDMAKKLIPKYPIKYFRLYTDIKENKEALPLYDKYMDIKEMYHNHNDVNYDGNCIIYSKSLTQEKVQKWDDKFLNLKQIIEEQGN